MPVAASRILDFLEEREAFTVERHEIASPAFGALRRSLRQIVLKLRGADEGEALEITIRLKALLSEWLTVPVVFDRSMADAVRDLFGGADRVRGRWGSDILSQYKAAIQAADGLPSIENPVREKLRETIRELRLQGQSFKVYCHRRARPWFESLPVSPEDAPLSESAFLHSVRDYREIEPFDVLIKVGPLRSRGWGSAPDALITAPRFGTLVLVVWSGCGDEPGFGYDPSSPMTAASDTTSITTARADHATLRWTERVKRTGEDVTGITEYAFGDDESDELQLFREIRHQPDQTRRAKLIQIDAEHGILFPPYSLVLSFDPTEGARQPIARRIPGETLHEGMFVLLPVLGDVSLGAVQAEHGNYSRVWKEKLRQEFSADEAGLILRLRAAGLNLVSLAGAIRHWCREPGTVIHAPQQIAHFRILARVLGLDTANGPQQAGTSWWQRAWNEIRRSRGEAISAGVLGHELVEEQLLVILNKLLPTIRHGAAANRSFTLMLPANSGVEGFLRFFPVLGIEEGFTVPDIQFRTVHELEFIDQWRD